MSDHHHDHEHKHPHPRRPAMSRRAFLRRSSETALVAAITVTSAGALLNTAEAWGMEVKAVKPQTMTTLIQIARDIYPHDKVPDRFYAIAVKGHDEKAAKDADYKAMIEGGVAAIDAASGKGGYLAVGWEAQRVAILRKFEQTGFFQTVRSGLVVSLYNQQEIWPIFGYEGESYSKGGYINRGFNDIDWL
ncbi:gluconate 2-dehydrogenase subunit 3 family protein [Alsobacter sp. R-9]